MESFLTLCPPKAPAYWRPSHTATISSGKTLLVGQYKTMIYNDRKTSPICFFLIVEPRGFSDDSVIKIPPVNAGDMGSIPGPGISHVLLSN